MQYKKIDTLSNHEHNWILIDKIYIYILSCQLAISFTTFLPIKRVGHWFGYY